MKLTDRPDIEPLEDWVNLTEAAETLGYTRSYMYKKASRPADQGGFKTLRKIGNKGFFIVRASEVNELLQAREDRKAAVVEEEPKPKKAPRKKPTEPTSPIVEEEPMPIIAEPPTPEPAEEEEEELSLEEILSKL